LAFISSVVNVAVAGVSGTIGGEFTSTVLAAGILETGINIVFVLFASFANVVVGAFASVAVVCVDALTSVLTWVFSETGIMFADNGVNVFEEVVDIGVDAGIFGQSAADTE
jgi:hypothetical protein